jgi:hypothetical protein
MSARLMMALEEVDESTMKFKAMYDRVHVDEKWFFVSKVDQRYYLANDENVPVRKCKHKSHIKKVCVVSPPSIIVFL